MKVLLCPIPCFEVLSFAAGSTGTKYSQCRRPVPGHRANTVQYRHLPVLQASTFLRPFTVLDSRVGLIGLEKSVVVLHTSAGSPL